MTSTAARTYIGLGVASRAGAEEAAFDFDDVVAGLFQRDADDLELLAGVGLGQIAAGHALPVLEEGAVPWRTRVHHIRRRPCRCRSWWFGLLLEFGQRLHGGEDVGVVGEALVGEAPGRHL